MQVELKSDERIDQLYRDDIQIIQIGRAHV